MKNQHHTGESNTPHESSIAVLPVQVAFEGLRLQNGRVLSIAVDKPTTAFIVACREGEEITMVASRHDTPGEAETAAKALEKRIKEAGEAMLDTADELDRIAKAAGKKH